MTDESPAKRFERWLVENPPPPREKGPYDWPTRVVGAALIVACVAFFGWAGWQLARFAGLLP